MTEFQLSSAARHPRRARRIVLLGLWLALACATSCVSVEAQGDRAAQAGSHKQALELYEEAMQKGKNEPELYHKAARAAVAAGDFPAAERYFARAIQHGAGLDVARELAEFYVQTNNYASAIRVYQFLLYQEKDPQPVYNNLGTALMYSGSPFDAESYLMIAQQMDPADPIPYVNLGLLYDRYLSQPWLAINFYECFLELDEQESGRARLVRQRTQELRQKWARLHDAEAVACGEVFEPPAPRAPVADLKKELGAPDEPISLDDIDEEPAPKGEDEAPETAQSGEDSEKGAPSEGVAIERMVDEDEMTDAQQSEPAHDPAGAKLERAGQAYRSSRWETVVELLHELPLKRLDALHMRWLGEALGQLGRWGEAVRWLEMSFARAKTPETLALLIAAYHNDGNKTRLIAVCREYRDKPAFASALDGCPTPMTEEQFEKLIVPRTSPPAEN